MQLIVADLIDAMALRVLTTDDLGVPDEVVKATLRQAKLELLDTSQHGYIRYCFIQAQKPLTSPVNSGE